MPPRELRGRAGDWLFGCDVCQEVCPWNRKAPVSSDRDFVPSEDAVNLDPEQFEEGLRRLAEREAEEAAEAAAAEADDPEGDDPESEA